MTQTNTNQASAWRGGIVVVALVLGLLLLALGAAYYLTPGQSVQYKTQYVLWKCGLAEDPGPDFETLIKLIESTITPESWEELGGPGAIPPFETNLSILLSETKETIVSDPKELDE